MRGGDLPVFSAATREEDIASWVDACPPTEAARQALVSLLPEEHPLYTSRSTSETARIRGYTLAAFERVGLPRDALPYVLDELQNGDEAYLVAAAAKALRGAVGADDVGFAIPILEGAERTIQFADAPVTFEAYKPRPPFAHSTTATEEIRRTLGWIGEADCCAVPALPRAPRPWRPNRDVELQDQHGRRVRFGEFFAGKPAAVAFFYSRCENVRKCSLTVTHLAAVQCALERRGLAGRVRLAAITYDPLFDLPPRLETYGRERGITFSDDVRFLRVPEGFDDVRDAFGLGVNYVGAIVNRHRIELHVLDARGRVVRSFTRLAWNPDDVADGLERLAGRRPLADTVRAALAITASVVVALLPKCPLCLGAYASALGLGALQLAPYRPWLLPTALVLVALHLVALTRRTSRTRRVAPLLVSTAGAIALVVGTLAWPMPALSLAGALTVTVGAVLKVARQNFRRSPPPTWKRPPLARSTEVAVASVFATLNSARLKRTNPSTPTAG